MYLHLGQSVVIPEREIIGIFDLDITSQSHLTRDYLNRSEREGEVVNVSDELPKSFVVTCPKTKKRPRGRSTLYLSQLAPQTLLRRSGGVWLEPHRLDETEHTEITER